MQSQQHATPWHIHAEITSNTEQARLVISDSHLTMVDLVIFNIADVSFAEAVAGLTARYGQLNVITQWRGDIVDTGEVGVADTLFAQWLQLLDPVTPAQLQKKLDDVLAMLQAELKRLERCQEVAKANDMHNFFDGTKKRSLQTHRVLQMAKRIAAS